MNGASTSSASSCRSLLLAVATEVLLSGFLASALEDPCTSKHFTEALVGLLYTPLQTY